jgi:hypothetical protein
MPVKPTPPTSSGFGTGVRNYAYPSIDDQDNSSINNGLAGQEWNDYNVKLNQYNQDMEAYNASTSSAQTSTDSVVPAVPLPSYDELVYNPMENWNYEQSPAYKAKYSLGMEELNKQMQARGLASSAVGGNRALDFARRLTADDYTTERGYETGRRTDRYKGLMSENTDAYNRLLDQVRIGQGAAGSLGSAGNQYAQGVGQATMAAGQAQAGFYAGLPGMAYNTAAAGLKAYDTGQRAGWWGSGNNNTNDSTVMPDSDNYSYSGLYNF